ncbi:MAG TPA: alanine dehydrogenase [Nitrospirota bacterium]|nr:alanine dehydrogenase [Nitrospirota bacterium]
MMIGVPKEIKTEEFRVGITPFGVHDLKRQGHTILIERSAGAGSGFPDEEYVKAGAEIVVKDKLFAAADLVLKVKEPLPQEYDLLREEQALFTYLHLAPNRELTEVLLRKKVTGIGYETLTKDNTLPLLAPMSEIAGRMAPLMGIFYLQKFKGGSGILATGASGVKPAKIVIIGAGVVGTNAARVASSLGMQTIVMNKGTERLRKIDEMFMGRVETLPVTAQTIAEEIKDADIIVGAVLVPGGRTPILITRQMLMTMKKGSVIVDVSVDQGGCIETSKPTTHDDPVFEVDGIIHYCVANMPGAYPRTSTLALTNATLPYVKIIAEKGIGRAVQEDPIIRSALNTYHGEIVNKALAESLGLQRSITF